MASGTLKAAALLAAAGLIGMGAWHWATRWRPAPERYPLQGVDLPLGAPALDWGSVRAAGADFAYVAATAGLAQRAPAFEANWQALPEAGLRRGAVHLFDPCADGRAQADAFNAVVPRVADALPPTVAVEDTGDCPAEKTAFEVKRFAAAVEAHYGRPMILRVSRSVEGRHHLAAAIERPVWVMGSLVQPRYAARPWRMWRASDMRRVEGVEQAMNWDVVAP